jgi:hypothetical protein
MSEDGAAGKDEGQAGERIDQERREAVLRLAKYTAPAMLAVLLPLTYAGAKPIIIVSGIHKEPPS